MTSLPLTHQKHLSTWTTFGGPRPRYTTPGKELTQFPVLGPWCRVAWTVILVTENIEDPIVQKGPLKCTLKFLLLSHTQSWGWLGGFADPAKSDPTYWVLWGLDEQDPIILIMSQAYQDLDHTPTNLWNGLEPIHDMLFFIWRYTPTWEWCGCFAVLTKSSVPQLECS